MRAPLISILFLLPFAAFSQVDYKPMTVSLGGGITVPHADVTDFTVKPMGAAAFHYNITPYTSIGLDTEFGKMEGNYHDISAFSNKFVTAAVDARVQVRQFTGEDVSGFTAALSRIYAGAGLGLMHSNAESWDPSAEESILSSYKGSDMIVPVFAGLNIPVVQEMDLDVLTLFLNYRLNLSFSDQLDALDNPNSASNDYLSTFSAGLRINLGRQKSYFYWKRR